MSELSPKPRDWYDRLPKAELHLHLEGAIPLPALWELMQKYGGTSAASDLAALRSRFVFRDFPHFIDTWVWKNSFLREYEDFRLISRAVAQDLREQNVCYAEAFFSPSDFARHGLQTQGLAQAIRAGLDEVPGVEIALIADLVRDRPPEQAERTLDELCEVRDMGVIGVGLGGSEQAYPSEPFAGVYARARRLGFHATAHAGEAAGAESIWGALRSLRVERIGHGTRAGEDPRLLEYLVENQVPVEMCPLSNVRTGVVAAIGAHPIRRFFELGLMVTVNTDDPKMFHNSLAEEYRLLVEELGFSRDALRTVISNALRGAWLAEDRRAALLQRFTADPAWRE